MRRFAILVSLISTLAFAASAQGIAVGSKIDNFSLLDQNGKMQSLNAMKGTNGAVIMFVSSQCPVVRDYNERMNQIAADYSANGITFIGINSNSSEMDSIAGTPLAGTKTHIDSTYKFSVLFDKGNVVADKLGATVTPEAYYIDANYVLLYHGAIDNDRSGASIGNPYLRTAFDAGLAGTKIERSTAKAFGCSIKRAK